MEIKLHFKAVAIASIIGLEWYILSDFKDLYL